MLMLHKESHLDHGLKKEMIEFILARFADRNEFFLESFELPQELGTLDCALHGPACGDAPVPEEDVIYEKRGTREWTSRLCAREPKKTRVCTVIAGPHDGQPCVLFTAFGGPSTPREPGDPECRDVEESKKFWAEHALSI